MNLFKVNQSASTTACAAICVVAGSAAATAADGQYLYRP